MKPVLIIISGPPASGKSTIATCLSANLAIPCLGKDSMKEVLFDSLGSQDRDWSKQLGKASIDLLYLFIKSQLSVGNSCIVESNFKRDWDRNRVLEMVETYNALAGNIYCTADVEVLTERFEKRAMSNRHPGHCDESNLDEFKVVLSQPWPSLLNKKEGLIKIDTTDFSNVDKSAIVDTLREWITEQNDTADSGPRKL